MSLCCAKAFGTAVPCRLLASTGCICVGQACVGCDALPAVLSLLLLLL